ncbi:hypothetical protein [Flavobacterium rhizosphaerae]|uniref:Lipoprotein n=1 Tax=Flavobacterium rhizosphaerae TaxID=3163298 RepID=A0ABW8Z2W4_9FLAO
MKKLLVVPIAVIASLVFVACSDEDTQPHINYVVCQVCEIEYQEQFGNQDYEVCVSADTIAYVNNGNTGLDPEYYFSLYCQNDFAGIGGVDEPGEGGGGSNEPGEATDNCVTCAAYEINNVPVPATEVCKGTNGNAFIGEIDMGIAYSQYIQAQEMFTDCN